MLEQLLHLPGVQTSAALGHVFAVLGRVDDAQEAYSDAWAAGDLEALWGWTALLCGCGEQEEDHAWEPLISSVFDALRGGQLTHNEALLWTRVVATWHTLTSPDPGEGLEIWLRLVAEVPDVSFPLTLAPTSRTMGSDRWWCEAIDSLWGLMGRVSGGPLLGYQAMRHHHLVATCRDEGIQRSRSRLEWAASQAQGATHYLAMRYLDRVLDVSAELVEHNPFVLSAGGMIHAYFRILEDVQDLRERSVYRMRYLNLIARKGSFEQALEGWQDLQEHDLPLNDILREHTQRMHIVQGRWKEAAHQALDRARRAQDLDTHTALVLLGLEYTRHAGEAFSPEILSVVRGLLDELPHDSPAFQLLFEVYEGSLLSAGQTQDLNALWDAYARPHSKRDRSVERVVAHWFAHRTFQGLDFAQLSSSRIRLWLLLAARQTTDTQTILQWLLSPHNTPRNDSEHLLYALFVLLHSSPNVPAYQKALNDLTQRFQDDTTHGGSDLLLYYVTRHAWELQGQTSCVIDLTTLATPHQPKPIAASLQGSIARELLALGKVQRALEHARRAFRLHPLEPEVRDILRDAAEAANSQPDRDLVSNIIDDTELSLRMGELPQWRSPYAALESKLEGSLAERHSAVADLESLARSVQDPALRSALLRRATEIALSLLPSDVVHDPSSTHRQRALRLAQTCAHTSLQDPLALHASLSTCLSLGAWSDAIRILESRPASSLLSAEMIDMLFQSARVCVDAHDLYEARTLFTHALQSAELHSYTPSLRADFDQTQALFLQAEDLGAWRDLLESLLENQPTQDVACEIHSRLGHLYIQHLPNADLAVAHFKRALQARSTREDAFQALESLYGRDGRFTELAQILLERADETRTHLQTTHNPTDRLLLCEHLFAYARVLVDHLQKPHEALNAVRELLTLHPQHAEALRLSASLNRSLGQSRELYQTLHALLPLEHDNDTRSALFFELGNLAQELHEHVDKQVELYTKSIHLTPASAAPYNALCNLLEHTSNWSALWDLFERTLAVVERLPSSDIPLEQLHSDRARIAYAHLGKPNESARSFLKALRLNPHEGRYLQMLEIIANNNPIHDLVLEAQTLRIQALPTEDPERRSLMHAHARLLQQQKREDAAIEVYRNILSIWPANLKAAERLETAYKDSERWSDLVAFYQDRLTSGASMDTVVPIYWAIAHVAERKLRDVEMAIDTYTRLLELVPANIDVLRSLGRLLEATRRWEKLIEISKREVKLTEQPKLKAHIYFRIGSLYETLSGMDSQAISYYERAIEQDPSCAPALHGLREIYRRQERWDDVIETLRREGVLWKEPREQASIFTRIAEIHHRHLGRFEEAERLLSKALRLSPELTIALEEYLDLMLAQKRWKDAEKFALALTRKSEHQPSEERATLFFKRAVIAQHLNHTEEAIAALRITLDLNPHHTDALRTLLDLFSDAHLSDAARIDSADHIEFLGRLEKQLVERADVRGQATLCTYRGSLAEQRLDLEEALRLYTRAAHLCPLDIQAQKPLVRLWIKLRRFDNAEEHWRAALKRLTFLGPRPTQPSSSGGRVAILLEIARLKMDWMNQPDQALVSLLEAQRLQPRNDEVLWVACQCYVLLERWTDALRSVDRLLALLDTSHDRVASALYYRGWILSHGLQRDDDALQSYSQSRSVDRTDPRPTLGAATILERTQHWIRLESLLRGSMPSTPTHDIPVSLRLARIYKDRKDTAKAQATYQSLLHIPTLDHATRLRVHVALARLTSRRSEKYDALHAALHLDPTHREALELRASVAQKPRERAWFTSLLQTFGWCSPTDATWLQTAKDQHPAWSAPIALKSQVRETLFPPQTQGPEFAGLRVALPIVRRLTMSNAPPPPSHPIQHPQLLREYTALSSWLSLPSPPPTFFYQDPQETDPVRFFNTDLTTTRTLVALYDPSHPPPFIRAQCAWALSFHALNAAPWCMRYHSSLDEGSVLLANVIELLVRLQEGESLPGLRREPHLRSFVRKLQSSEVATLDQAVHAMHAIAMATSVTRDPEDNAQARAQRIQDDLDQFAARIALLASGEPATVVDMAISRWHNTPFRTLQPHERLAHCKDSKTLTELLRFAVSIGAALAV